MAKAKDKPASGVQLEIPCSFGNVNVGDETARISIRISRQSLTLAKADSIFSGKRITGTILARAGGGGPDQESLPGIEDDIEITDTFDVSSFGVSAKRISTGLTVAINSVDVGELAHFAKRDGRLTVRSVGEIPDGEGGDPGEDEE